MASKVVHVHGQRRPGDPLEITGTREGLRALAATLRQAASAEPTCSRLFDASGEPYAVLVVADPTDPRASATWAEAARPYIAGEDRNQPDKKYPFDVVGWEKFGELSKKVGIR